MSVHSCHLLFDHFQFALIHGPDIPGSCAVLFFAALDLTPITGHIRSWALFLHWPHLFFLEWFLRSSPVACWAPADPGVHLSVSFLPFHPVHVSLFVWSCFSFFFFFLNYFRTVEDPMLFYSKILSVVYPGDILLHKHNTVFKTQEIQFWHSAAMCSTVHAKSVVSTL